MRSFFSFIFWLVFISALLGGGYIAYGWWWDGAPPKFVTDYLKEGKGLFTAAAEKVGGKITEEIKIKAGEYASEYLKEAQEKAKDVGKGVAAGVLSSIGEKIQTISVSLHEAASTKEKSTSDKLTPEENGREATITTQEGKPLNFSISTSETKEKYIINWGDGETHEGEVKKDTPSQVNHAWTHEGEYKVKIIVGEKITRIFPVKVDKTK